MVMKDALSILVEILFIAFIKFHIVTQIGRNWNQLITELIGWQTLGKDIIAAKELA